MPRLSQRDVYAAYMLRSSDHSTNFAWRLAEVRSNCDRLICSLGMLPSRQVPTS